MPNRSKITKALLIFFGMVLLILFIRIVHDANSQTLTEYVSEQANE